MGTADTAVEAWEALFRAQVTVMRQLRADFGGLGLSMNEYDVLFNIMREPGQRIRLRDLNRNVLITQSSVSRLVDRLVERGLLDKCSDAHDARGAIVSITRTGRLEFARAAKRHMDSIRDRVGGALDEDELQALARICGKLRLAVGSEGGHAHPDDQPPIATPNASPSA